MNTDPGCYFHGEEPIPHDVYRLCGECGHAYTTANDLLDAYNFETDVINGAMSMFDSPIPHETDVGRIYSCPLCTHDW
jgi:hypothetical protein